jgi:hypothetical protein
MKNMNTMNSVEKTPTPYPATTLFSPKMKMSEVNAKMIM